jgi:hypothetical protein
MATGLPVIALSSEGQGDVCDDAGELVLSAPPSHWEKNIEPAYGECGVRGVPDVREVVKWLRWVATHRSEAQELGRKASDWATKDRNVWNKPVRFLDVLRSYSG